MFTPTRWRHGNDVFVNLLWMSLSSFIGCNHSYPVHGQGLQTCYSERGLDDGIRIAAAPLDLVCRSDFHKVSFHVIFHSFHHIWFSPSQAQSVVTRVSYFEIFNLPRRLCDEKSSLMTTTLQISQS